MVTNSVILDFGSEKITVLIGSKGANNTLRVAGKAAVPYAGFMFGDWIDRKNLPGVIAKALNDAAKVAGARIDKVYVGVPGEACALVTKEVNTVFNRKRKLKETDVFELHSQGEEFDPEAYEVINIQPVYYTIDNERRVISPVGQVTARFGGVLSYFLADRAFTDYVKGVLLDMGVPEVEFVCSPLAEALLLISDEKRDATAVLIDVGYLTSTVSVVRGDGMLSLSSFSMGGGNITADLATALEIPFSVAEELKRKVVLTLDPSDDDAYEVTTPDGVTEFSTKLVNEIVSHRVLSVANTVNKCLAACEYEIPSYVTYMLTGGGISYIRGAKDVLGARIGRNVTVAVPPFPQVNRPDASASYGLLDMAVKNDSVEKKGFFARLFRR